MENTIDFFTFRQLLESLENSEVLVRLRILGESWIGFSRLILLSQNAMILQNGTERKIVLNVRNVVEFEVNRQIGDISPNLPYQISH